ncbi:MAG: hypothetical protein AAGH87_03525 [Pseudomonadota bacterium]
MLQQLQVTAQNGLVIRRLPDAESDRLAAMPRGMVVEALDARIWKGRWRRIRATFAGAAMVEGYGAGEHLAATGFHAALLRPLTGVATPRAFDTELHAVFLAKLRATLEACRRRNWRFRLYEAYRQPSRQAHLFRSPDPGTAAGTQADAWQSLQNYGLAADLILNIHGIDPWETGKINGHAYLRDWTAMRRIALSKGLEVATSEDGLSHDWSRVSLPGIDLAALQAGEFPSGGGAIWEANVKRNALAYRRGAPASLLERALEDTPDPAPDRAPDSGPEPAPPPPQPAPISRIDHVLKAVSAPVVAGFFHHSAAANVERYLPMVLRALHEQGLDDWPHIIVALATIKAESAGFASIPEGQSRYNTEAGGAPFALYDFREDIGNSAPGHGYTYRGRGFIQLTGKANYERYGELLDIDLVNQPDRALEPMTAARILALFMKDQKARIERAWAGENWRDARKAVNGGTHGLDNFMTVIDAARALLPWANPL